MPTWKDNQGREWKVSLTIAMLDAIKEHFDVDLGNAYQNEASLQVDADIVLLVKIMTVVSEDQITSRQMTPEDFGACLVGDPIDEAKEALFEALVNFFPKSKRDLFLKQLERQETAWKMALEGLEEIADENEMRQLMNDALEEAKRNLRTFGTPSP